MAYIKKSVLPSQAGNSGKFLKSDGTNTLWGAGGAGGGDLVSTNNLSDVANVATARTNLGLDTTANQTDSANKRFMSDAQETKLDGISGTNTGDETASTLGATLNGAGAAVPNDTDIVATAASSVLKKITWTNVKAFLKTYFDTLYQAAGSYLTASNISDTAYGAGWNGDTTNAPSKNAVYDKIDAMDTTIAGKQSTLTNPVTGTGTNNEIAAFNSTGSTITSLSVATYPSLTELSYVKGVTSSLQTQINGKEPTITNGFGLTGTNTKAVSLTTSEAFCTAETTLSAATYADITGASITIAAGTWLILATINGSSQTTTATVLIGAITHSDNTVLAEGAQHIVAGTATVRTWGNVTLSAIVTPAGSTTYKLRGARGTTTQTGNCIVSDGTGLNTANNVSNNSDKSTSIRAIRIA